MTVEASRDQMGGHFHILGTKAGSVRSGSGAREALFTHFARARNGIGIVEAQDRFPFMSDEMRFDIVIVK